GVAVPAWAAVGTATMAASISPVRPSIVPWPLQFSSAMAASRRVRSMSTTAARVMFPEDAACAATQRACRLPMMPRPTTPILRGLGAMVSPDAPSAHRSPYGGDDAVLVVGAEVRMHGQADHILRQLFGDGQPATRHGETAVGRLHVDGLRIEN